MRSVCAHCLVQTDPPPLRVCGSQICRETCTPHKRFRCQECWQARLDESIATAAAEAPQRNLRLLIRPALHRALKSLQEMADVDAHDGGAGLAEFTRGVYKGKFEAEMAAAVRDARDSGVPLDEVANLLREGALEAGLSLPPEWSAAPEGEGTEQAEDQRTEADADAQQGASGPAEATDTTSQQPAGGAARTSRAGRTLTRKRPFGEE